MKRETLWNEYVKQEYSARIGRSVIRFNVVTDWNGKEHFCHTIFSAFSLFCKLNKESID